MRGKLARIGRRAVAAQRAAGLPVTFQRGDQVLRELPDGTVQVLATDPAGVVPRPRRRAAAPPAMTGRPRLRMVAGPNGSGKTSLLRALSQQYRFPLGFDLNADDVQRDLVATGRLDFAAFGVTADAAGVRQFCRDHPLGGRIDPDRFTVEDNALHVPVAARSAYLAAVLADLLRRTWVAAGQSFTFETVMSSGDKVDRMADARDRAGYRTSLYYVCTNSPAINLDRVAVRVRQGGHPVPDEKVVDRYRRSLALLPRALARADRAYLFDNSPRAHRLVAEHEGGSAGDVVRRRAELVRHGRAERRLTTAGAIVGRLPPPP